MEHLALFIIIDTCMIPNLFLSYTSLIFLCKQCIEDLGPTSHETRRLLQIWDQLQVNDGVVYRARPSLPTRVVPRSILSACCVEGREGLADVISIHNRGRT